MASDAVVVVLAALNVWNMAPMWRTTLRDLWRWLRPLRHPDGACECLEPVVGSYADVGIGRCLPYTLSDKWHARLDCPKCGGHGRTPEWMAKREAERYRRQ
jgi:hypothetical protein